MKQSRKTPVLACALFALFACNSISGLDEDFVLDLSSTTTPPSGAGDGGPDGTTGIPDGGPSTDGPVTVPDGGCPSPLPATTLFCDDFENTSNPPPLYGWTRREFKGGEPTVQTFGLNDSRGLRATAQGPCNDNSCTVVLWRNVAPQFNRGSTLTLSLYFRVAAMGTDYAVIGAVQVSSGGGGYEYGIAAHKHPSCPGGGLCIDQNQPSGQATFANAAPITLGSWHRADVIIVRDNADGYAGRVVLDGTTTLDQRPNAFAWQNAIQPSSVEVGIGAFFSGAPATATEMHVDNVVVTRTP